MKNVKFLTLILIAGMLASCGGESTNNDNAETPVNAVEEAVVEEAAAEAPASDKGIGPITSITLGEIDEALVEKGKEIYKANCTACHKIGKRFVGPALAGVTERRTPEWVMNIIMNPEEMAKKDPTAKALLAEYLAPMANQNITEEEARAILEFLRTKTK